MYCIHCNSRLDGLKKKFCSTKCKNKYHQANCYTKQRERAYKRKKELVKMAGNCCSACGYNKNLAALQFHHVDPSTKEFNLDARKLSNSTMTKIKTEFKKCILLCSNCHFELHNPDYIL